MAIKDSLPFTLLYVVYFVLQLKGVVLLKNKNYRTDVAPFTNDDESFRVLRVVQDFTSRAEHVSGRATNVAQFFSCSTSSYAF